MNVKEIQARYLISPYFKDLYLYLTQNKLPNTKSAIRKVEMLEERYILLDSLPFKYITIPEKETALLATPEICANQIVKLYHSSLSAGHQGVRKTYLTIGDKFFIQGLIHHLRSYIIGCHKCQLSRNENPPVRQLQQRINLIYRSLSRLSMDLKVIPKSYKAPTFILCIVHKVMTYLITVPI